MGETVFKAQNLTVDYGQTSVLWDISFTIPQGKLVGVIGPNGAGKSTLLKTALGIVKPTAGQVRFFGQNFKDVREKVAYIPQRSSVDWDFPITVLEVVLMGRYGKLGWLKWPRQADKIAAMQALEMLEMDAFEGRQIDQLSGGQQQRVFLARALLQDADIYLLDEPFAGVDLATEKAIMILLKKLKKQGKTLFVVHHDLNAVQEYFDWVVLLNTSLVACGETEQVFNQDNIARTYGQKGALLAEVTKLSKSKQEGFCK
ncbi:MAG: metal ABC transporter ATP-binding protein [Chlamydiia bacterium]|nr:metal ABC transporter ATP-binding protein [Chlamydiia bacterium]MCP5510137.1 metal ABC transporter ATP-binding protein [Chlamydiales bacterium]